jgi:hypothetical protein
MCTRCFSIHLLDESLAVARHFFNAFSYYTFSDHQVFLYASTPEMPGGRQTFLSLASGEALGGCQTFLNASSGETLNSH